MKNNKLQNQRFLIIILGALIPMILLPFYFDHIKVDSYIAENHVFSDIYIQSNHATEDIKLSYNEKTKNWYAFIPSHLSNETIQFSHKFKTLSIVDDSNVVNPKISLQDYNNGDTINLRVKHNQNIIASEQVILYQADYIPTMYIHTVSGNMDNIHASKDNKEHANYSIYTSAGKTDANGECVIKGRGNSSWVGGMDGKGEKKPYNITLSTACSLLDMNSQTKWTLLACYDDQAFIRNKIALELAQKMDMEYTSQSKFINLYTNGEYKGLYLLTQRVTTGTESINTSGEYLLEFDTRLDNNTSGWFTTSRNKIAIKSPEPASTEQVDYITNYMRNIENLIFDDNSNTNDYSSYIDIDSWAKMYVLQDFLFNIDVNYASFYVYKKNNSNALYAGPLWDFDLSMGNLPWGEYMEFTQQVQWIEGNHNRLWLNALMNKPDFSTAVQDIYQNTFWNLLADITETDISFWTEQLNISATMDALLWGKENYDFTEKASELIEWLINRKQFIIEYNANPENYNKIIFKIDADKDFIYCIKKGETLNCIPEFAGYQWINANGNPIDTETSFSHNEIFTLAERTF